MNIYNVIMDKNINNKDKIAAYITMDNGQQREYSYSMLFEEAQVFAKRLENAGVVNGDRVIIVAENSPEWNIAYLSIMKIRCTAVLIDASLTKEEILRLIDKSDGKCIYTSPKIMSKLNCNPAEKIPVLDIMNRGQAFENCTSSISKTIPKTIDGDEDIAFIIYSSGTTKSASGIMHTHKAMNETIKMTVDENDLTCNERILSILPNSHIYGVVCGLLGSMMLGASINYLESISNEALLATFKKYKPTVFPCVPKVLELFQKQIQKKIDSKKATKYIFKVFFPICKTIRKYTNINLGKLLFKSIHKGFGGELRVITCAGAPLDEAIVEFYYGTGFNVLVTYGLTETNIPVIGNRFKTIVTNSCGKPYPNIQVRLANKDDKGDGEIYIKSPYMMKGYFRDPIADKEAFQEGWFKTGDVAKMDAKGNVNIIGRCKDNIVLNSGKKVTPEDVESKYINISGVKEFVACGVPALGADYDEIHAFIVKDSSLITSEDILREIQDKGGKLSLYMKILKVHFIDEIPMTSLQKPKRYLLKKYALENGGKSKENKEDVQSEKNTLNIEQEVISIIIKTGGLNPILVNSNSKIFSELGIDSLGAIEISVQIEEKWGVRIDDSFYEDITIAEIVEIIKAPEKIKSKAYGIYPKRKTMLHYILFRFHCRLAHFFYKVNTKNNNYIPVDSGYIICANHVSNFDYLWITMKLKKEQFLNFCCMAKTELFNKSVSSKILARICGMIPVDRGSLNSDAMKCCKKQLEENWGLLIHPEGTRSHDGEIGLLKKGAASLAIEANVPIIPAYIRGSYNIYPKGRKLPKLFDWKNMRKFNVDVIYGEPIHPQNLTIEALTKLVESSIVALNS